MVAVTLLVILVIVLVIYCRKKDRKKVDRRGNEVAGKESATLAFAKLQEEEYSEVEVAFAETEIKEDRSQSS